MTRIYAAIGLVIAALGLGFYWAWSWQGSRFEAYRADQSELAAAQEAVNQQKDKEYASKTLTADVRLAEATAMLAALRAQPVQRLVCARPSPRAVPSVPASADTRAASTGVLPQSSSEGFDPSPAVVSHADEADVIVEMCRAAIGKWPS